MYFHLSAYTVLGGVNDANVDMAVAPDTVFTSRSSHLIMSEPYNLIGLFAHGANLLRVRSNISSWNAIGRHVVHPPWRSATIPDKPILQDYRMEPLPLPMTEEIQWEESNNLGAATEREQLYLWIADAGWTMNIPAGVRPVGGRVPRIVNLRATATITTVANAWSGLNAITLADNLRGGWYAMVGANVQAANTLAFRWHFPRSPFVAQRQFRPGSLAQEAIGNTPLASNNLGFGVWGQFDAYELPQLEVFANAAAAVAHEIRLQVVYLGPNIQAG